MKVSLLPLLLLISVAHLTTVSAWWWSAQTQPTFQFYPKNYVASSAGRTAGMDTHWNNLLDHSDQLLESGSYTATHLAKITLPVGHKTLPAGGDIYRLANQHADGSWSLDLSPDVIRDGAGDPLAVRVVNKDNYKNRIESLTNGNPPQPGEQVLFTHPGKASGLMDTESVKTQGHTKHRDEVNIEHLSGVAPDPGGDARGRVTLGWVLKDTNSLGGDGIGVASGRAKVYKDYTGKLGMYYGTHYAETVGIQFKGGHALRPPLAPAPPFANQKIGPAPPPPPPKGWFSWFR